MGAPISLPVAATPTADPRHTVFATDIVPRLRAAVGPKAFESWFDRLELDRIEDGRAVLSVPTQFLRSWLQSNYEDQIRRAIADALPGVEPIITVRSSARAAAYRISEPAIRSPEAPAAQTHARPQPAPLAARAPIELLLGSPLDGRLTFGTLQVGAPNALAHAAASHVLEACARAARPTYTPLVIHGDVGVGKTHILQAVTAASVAAGRNAVYLTAERFLYGLHGSDREHLRRADLLAVDDLHFLTGGRIQRELGAAVDAFALAGKPLVVASATPPAGLDDLDAAVRSRLLASLVVEVRLPDLAMRTAIVAAKAAAIPGLKLTADIVAHVAETVTASARDLEGAVNRLAAHTGLVGRPLTLAEAAMAIADLARPREPKRPRIEDIVRLAARHYDVASTDILSSRRAANVVRPRQIAMYLAKVMTLRSLPEIGRRFGGRDHTTVLHAVNKIARLVGEDPALAEDVRSLRAILEG